MLNVWFKPDWALPDVTDRPRECWTVFVDRNDMSVNPSQLCHVGSPQEHTTDFFASSLVISTVSVLP